MPMQANPPEASANEGRAVSVEDFQELLVAANSGCAPAQYALGLIYQEGRAELQIESDPTEAIRWLVAAAEQDHVEARFSLGFYIPSDEPDQIVRWFRAAAENGHAEAAWQLGQEYTIGNPVSRDFQEAVKWYRVAADLGYASAQKSLGNAYAEGNGIQQDLEAAAYWLALAAANPNRFFDNDEEFEGS